MGRISRIFLFGLAAGFISAYAAPLDSSNPSPDLTVPRAAPELVPPPQSDAEKNILSAFLPGKLTTEMLEEWKKRFEEKKALDPAQKELDPAQKELDTAKKELDTAKKELVKTLVEGAHEIDEDVVKPQVERVVSSMAESSVAKEVLVSKMMRMAKVITGLEEFFISESIDMFAKVVSEIKSTKVLLKKLDDLYIDAEIENKKWPSLDG